MPQSTLPGTMPQQNVEQMTFDLPQPEPIKGFPELRWTGKRPFTSTHYYPAQLKERYGDTVDGWVNRIYWGDNLQVMSHLLKEFRGKVDLVYIDPPFDSKAAYKKTITLQGKAANSDSTSFEEKQYSDIWSNDQYLQFLYQRIILIKELLSDKGVFLIHCDYRENSYLRVMIDEIFGRKNLINEIVWKRRTGFLNQVNKLGVSTDTLLCYCKDVSNYTFNPQYIPYQPDDKYIKSKFTFSDEKGIYRLHAITSPSYSPSLIYEYKGYKPPANGWSFSKEKMEEWDREGKLYFPKDKNQRIQRKQYLHEMEGKPIQNLWDDIRPINSQSLDDTNYPTQKPEELLERIINMFSNPGDIILDCFMGSGTTQAVAMKLGRRFIGADINLGAIQTTTKRLNGIIDELKEQKQLSLPGSGNKPYPNFEVYNVNHYDVFRNPVQARELLLQALEVEPLESTDVFDGMKAGYKVKIMPVNRIATRADLNPILSGINYREMDKRMEASPGSPAERIMLVCMGHEPDLAASLKMDIGDQYRVDVQVVDILRDRKNLAFKYDSEADIAVENGELVIRQFYPRNLLQKLSMLDENVEDWRQLVETVAIDWNYNGEVLQPAVYDNPGKNELVQGRYKVQGDHGLIRVKITDLLSESLETTLEAD